MADLQVVQTQVSQVKVGAVQVGLKSGDRIVTVINPTTLEGGTIVTDGTVPAGKTMKGWAGAVSGQLTDAK